MHIEFQFHKGTIRTCEFTRSKLVLNIHFNSIKVQLERKGGLGGVDHSGHFNSIKVQLEQSHARNNSKNRDFNSIKVQLEPL